MKPALLVAALLLVLSGVAGCGEGDGGGASRDAPSTEEFCEGLAVFRDGFADVDPSTDLPGYIRHLKDEAGRLADLGTPGDMPDDAREGFRITIERIRALPDDATLDDLDQFGDLGDVSDADQEKLDALERYIDRACPDLGQDSESASPEG